MYIEINKRLEKEKERLTKMEFTNDATLLKQNIEKITNMVKKSNNDINEGNESSESRENNNINSTANENGEHKNDLNSGSVGNSATLLPGQL